MTLEEAFELVIYYYANLEKASANTLFDRLSSGEYSLSEAITNTRFEDELLPDYLVDDTRTFEDPADDTPQVYYVFAISLSGKLVDKVASNFVKVVYTKDPSTGYVEEPKTTLVSLNSYFDSIV